MPCCRRDDAGSCGDRARPEAQHAPPRRSHHRDDRSRRAQLSERAAATGVSDVLNKPLHKRSCRIVAETVGRAEHCPCRIGRGAPPDPVGVAAVLRAAANSVAPSATGRPSTLRAAAPCLRDGRVDLRLRGLDGLPNTGAIVRREWSGCRARSAGGLHHAVL